MKAVRLQTANLNQALGIDNLTPRLSWLCERGVKQSAYQVQAYNQKDELVFDSGKVETDSMHCKFQATHLESRDIITWQVCLWDEQGEISFSDNAVFEVGLLKPEDWSAKWLVGQDTDRAERLPADYFYKAFDVQSTVKQARLYATSLGTYVAKVNGKTVSSILAPGATNYDKRLYYQTYDVTECLNIGENELLLILSDGWHKGKLGSVQAEYLYGTQNKMLAQLEIIYEDGTSNTIATDGAFLWSNDGPIRFADLKDGEIYDAQKVLHFDKEAIVDTDEKRLPTASNAPAIKEHETFKPILLLSSNGQQILDFGQNIAGYVRFKVAAENGQVIKLHLFEATDHGNFSDISLSFPGGGVEPVKQEIVYISNGETELFQPEFFYSGFQYAWVEGLDEVNPDDFEAVAVYSDLQFGSQFTSSNEMINQFYQNTVWSMKGNFVDIPTDCPQREKSGWTGDAQVFCNTATYMADTFAFYRKWLKDVRDGQLSNGQIQDVNPKAVVPDSDHDQIKGSTGWADAAIIIPYTLWRKTGDSSYITDNIDLMLGWKDYVIGLCQDKSLFEPMTDGHPMKTLEPLYQMYKLPDSELNQFIPESGIHWGEWCVPESQEPRGDQIMELLKPKQEVTTAYLHYSMSMLYEMLVAIGNSEEAAICRKYADGSKAAYHFHWVVDGTIATEKMAELVRPLALRLLEGDEITHVAQALNDLVISRQYKVGTGFLSTPFILQTLAKTGYLDTAYRMLENTEAPSWLAMVKQGATTVWEEYECYDEHGTPLPHSFNHYSPGAVCAFLFDTICGITVTGENQVTLQPQPGGTLTYATATTQTAFGSVSSSWEVLDDTVIYRFDIPGNVTAQLILPSNEQHFLSAGHHEFKGEKLNATAII